MKNNTKFTFMKTIKDFSALKLSKSQMNSLNGGGTYNCTVKGEHVGFYKGVSAAKVEESLKSSYGEGVSCS